jgi:predicted AlkP superfamily phosphohydrolase/phosphomutase
MTVHPNDRPKRILVIGLDGGSPHVVQRLAQEGHMPFIKSVIDGGVFGSLQSVLPPLTPPAWTTFMTGKDPSKHGIFEFSALRGVDRPIRVNNSLAIH